MLNNPLLSPQELKEKTLRNCNSIQETLDKGIYIPEDASILAGLSMQDRFDVEKTIRGISLKEFLSRGQTLGNYLVAAKIHDVISAGARLGDRVPYISATVVSDWAGSDLTVNITGDTGWSFSPLTGSSGAIMGTTTGKTTAATCSPKLIAYNMRIGEDLLEDAHVQQNAGLIEQHIKWAGQEMGMEATRMAVVVLAANGDGVGTANSFAGDSAETKWSGSAGKDILSAWSECKYDGYNAQTIITNYESGHHSILAPATLGSFAPAREGFDFWLNGFDIYVHPYHTDLTATRLCTLVFDRNNALFTARKRWLQLENYSDPVKDLAGAVVTSRQDSVTLFKEATCKIEEAA